jgi:hypothetical protein
MGQFQGVPGPSQDAFDAQTQAIANLIDPQLVQPELTGGTLVYGGYWVIGNLVVVNMRIQLTSTQVAFTLPKPYGSLSSPGIPITGYGTNRALYASGIQVANGSVQISGTSNEILLIHASYIKE